MKSYEFMLYIMYIFVKNIFEIIKDKNSLQLDTKRTNN